MSPEPASPNSRRAARLPSALALLALAAPLSAQAGDHAGEEQPPLPAGLVVPPAPALAPEAEQATLRLPAGFRIELVASEPLVRDPVALCFDAQGRLWVVEMTGYMPDVEGHGEADPVGAVAVLSDGDGDGRMDRREVFLDGLVLPRAVVPTRGGALVLAPPELLFARDGDGDGRADEVTVVDRGLGGLASPEHAINGLLPTLDNALHCANAPWRYVFDDGAWKRERTAGGGQWGVTQDDVGRILFDTNSDPLRGDLIPSIYAARNSSHGHAAGVNVRLVGDMSVRPARMNPGVNRGYQQGLLDQRFRLAVYTAACAPWVARGHAVGPDALGDVFVCEPAGNLVARYELLEDDLGRLSGEPLRHGADGEVLDFLTSTDERFRPVALADGPDGALYVADMYRGLIQHRLFVTTFLRRQVEQRGLERPLGHGRIWRVVAESTRAAPAPDLAQGSWTEVVEALSHGSGWVRDTAQRILVEEGADSRDAHELARAAAASAQAPLGRMHALWALAGMGGIRREVALRALSDPDPRVLHAAVRTSEQLAGLGDAEILARWLELARSGDARLRWQVLLSLGEVPGSAGLAALARLAAEDCASGEARSAVISGLEGRESRFLELVLPQPAWGTELPGRAKLLELLARCVVREGRGAPVARLLDLAVASGRAGWQREALLAGVLAGRPPDPLGQPGYVRLALEPAAYAALALGSEAARQVAEALAWPGKPGVEEVEVRPLDPAEQARFEHGREVYAQVCASCHQPSGLGEPGTAPPLRWSPWALGSEGRLARILLFGLSGPLELGGETWNGEMPALAEDDGTIAAVLTYVRREWGHGADPVTPAAIARARGECADRKLPWTVEELEALEPE